MRGQVEFILVKRLEHGDEMAIPKHVAEKYPSKFEIVKPKAKVIKEATPKKKTVGGTGVERKASKEE